MGRIEARGKRGNLQFDFRFKGVRCREQTVLADTPANRKRMQDVLRKIEAEITLGTFEYQKYFPNSKVAAKLSVPAGVPGKALHGAAGGRTLATPLVREFAELVYAEQSITWRVSTQRWIRSLLDTHILPGLGARRLHEVSLEDLLQFRLGLAQKRSSTGRALSPKSINTIMRVMASVFAEGANRYGFTSPTVRIKKLKVQRKDIQPFSVSEVQSILGAVRKDFRNYLVVRFFTGLRTGEIDGLKWRYVDFERKLILVRETYTHGRVEYTKTDGSQRDVAMSQMVYDALRDQQKVAGKVEGKGADKPVFCNTVGGPIDAKNFTDRVWYPLLRHLGLRPRRPYETRHTCATLWLSAGENPEWIARQLGHTTTEMLFSTYSRFIANHTRQDGSAIERVLAQMFPE